MDFYEAIEKRRTIRKFKGPATEEQLKRIITAGTKAPSPGNRQGWEFIIVEDPALIEGISDIKYNINLARPVVTRGPKSTKKRLSVKRTPLPMPAWSSSFTAREPQTRPGPGAASKI